MNLVAIVQLLSITVATIVAGYIIIGVVGALLYSPNRSDHRAENVRFAITTIASDSVRPALMDCIDHHLSKFPEYELYVTLDEGCDLEDELVADDRYTTIVVPEDYECRAEAKGRAIQYFIETVVEADGENYWYGFIDDDNKILDDDILYEIPYYEEHGYGAANPVLIPRPGESMSTFVMDHLRTLDDLTVFKAFTGLLGKPYIGFHGELLTARGDVLADVTFDRPSIVEDYAFAARLLERDIPTWQTASRISILSPHSMGALFQQRRRWYLGLMQEQLRNPWIATLVMGFRMFAWTFACLGGIAAIPLWILAPHVDVPLGIRMLVIVSSVLYFGAYFYGVMQVKGWVQRLVHFVLIPLYAVLEGLTSIYSIVRYKSDFVVIDK